MRDWMPDEDHLNLDPPEEYERLSPLEKAALREWIRLAMEPHGRERYSSYYLKHEFERLDGLPNLDGFYVTNGQFKGAMLEAGYEPVQRNELGQRNWSFGVRPTAYPLRHKPSPPAGYHGESFGLWRVDGYELQPLVVLLEAAKAERLRVCPICGERGRHMHTLDEVADAGLIPCVVCGSAVTREEFDACSLCR
jgi:hypothetical protein